MFCFVILCFIRFSKGLSQTGSILCNHTSRTEPEVSKTKGLAYCTTCTYKLRHVLGLLFLELTRHSYTLLCMPMSYMDIRACTQKNRCHTCSIPFFGFNFRQVEESSRGNSGYQWYIPLNWRAHCRK